MSFLSKIVLKSRANMANISLFPALKCAFIQNPAVSRRIIAAVSYCGSRLDHRSLSGSLWRNNVGICQNGCKPSLTGELISIPDIKLRSLATSSDSDKNEPSEPEKKPSLLQRFKQMYKEYWYVVIPVHCVTSVFWAGGFYYLVKSGFDVVPFLESWSVSETILKPLRDTGAGYFAVTYALYKIASPARYMVTLGGTTVAINYLRRWGYIKPMPSRDRVREMIKEKGDELKSRRDSAMARFGRTSGDSDKREK